MKQVLLITDGACVGNPGPGGWAAILRYQKHRKELFGSSPRTTNNRMEMAAAIEGLRALKEPCEVQITTDSEYLKNGITKWIHDWRRRGWRTVTKTAVRNQDLWQELDQLCARHKATWVWTRGHATHRDNNRADRLASQAAHKQSFSKGSQPGIQSAKYGLYEDDDESDASTGLFDSGPGAGEP